jgi:molecular chaperone GrpE
MIDEEKQVGNAQNPTMETSEVHKSSQDPSAVEIDGAAGTEVNATVAASDQAEVQSGSGSAGAEPGQEIDYLAIVAQMDEEMKALKAQLDDRTSQYMRIAADFDNFRKRMQREKEEMEQQIKCSTINELLPVVDNFERARAQIKPQTEAETGIHKSYQSVYKQLVDCLKRIGVAPMRSEGKEFDPILHEAVMREPTDEYPEGTVIEELQRGYMLGERVLRHALVKVAAAPEPVITSEGGDQGGAES